MKKEGYCIHTLYTGPKPPWPSMLSSEKSLVTHVIVSKSNKGSSRSSSLLFILAFVSVSFEMCLASHYRSIFFFLFYLKRSYIIRSF